VATAKRAKLGAWMEGGMTRVLARLSAALGVNENDDQAQVENDIIDGPHLPQSHWADAVAAFEEGSKSDLEQARRLSAALATSDDERIAHYFSIFLTQEKKPRDRLITGALTNCYPELAERLSAEQERVVRLIERRNGVLCRERTAALVTIAA